jgi:type IVB pilus formation R64 PilN family outer membrane protein
MKPSPFFCWQFVWLATFMMVWVLQGCAIDELAAQGRDATRMAEGRLHQSSQRMQDAARAQARPIKTQRIAKPWVSGRAVELAPEITLPPVLRADVKTTLIFREGVKTLQGIAGRLAHATGIAVRVLPDALLPAHLFGPRLGSVQTTPAFAAPLERAMPMGTRPLVQVLDIVAADHDVQWRYTGKAIEFYRTQTRVFDVRALTLPASAEMRLGKGGGQKDGGFESSGQTSISMKSQSLMQAVRQRIEPFLTLAGQVAAQDDGLTSIVVTDTPGALDAVAHYLESLNRSMTRRVRLVFEEMTVSRREDHDQGVDWTVNLATDLASLSLGAANAQAGVTPVSASIGVSLPGFGGLSSKLILTAVSRYADVTRHTTVPVMTLNRRPVTHAVRSTFTYVDQVQSLSVAKNENTPSSLPGIAVSQKRETVGAFLTLVPDIQDDGQVLLSVAYDNTVALPLKTLSFGGATNAMHVQQLSLQGNGTVQQVAVRPGQPTLIAGFERQEHENVQSRLSPDAPRALGGQDKLGSENIITLIFVTAQVQEGG